MCVLYLLCVLCVFLAKLAINRNKLTHFTFDRVKRALATIDNTMSNRVCTCMCTDTHVCVCVCACMQMSPAASALYTYITNQSEIVVNKPKRKKKKKQIKIWNFVEEYMLSHVLSGMLGILRMFSIISQTHLLASAISIS